MFNQETTSNDLVKEEVITPLPVRLGKGILKVFLCLSHSLDFAFLSHYLIHTLCPAVREEFRLTGITLGYLLSHLMLLCACHLLLTLQWLH